MTAYRIEHDDVTGRFGVWWPVPRLRLIAVGDTIHAASLAMEAHWQQVLDGTDDPDLDLSQPTPPAPRHDVPDPSIESFHGKHRPGYDCGSIQCAECYPELLRRAQERSGG